MTVNIAYEDLAMMRIASRRWARQNPLNPNAKRVMEVVNRNYPKSGWQMEGDDREEMQKDREGNR